MRKEALKIMESRLERTLYISLFIYLFFLIFPHTTTIKEFTFWIAFLSWVVLRLRKSEPLITLNPVKIFSNGVNLIIVSLSLFMVVTFVSSVIGTEPLENLKRFKGELLIPFILFLIIATEFSSIEKVKPLFSSLLIAFAVYTLLAIIESTNYGLRYFWDETHREQYIWLTSYSQIGAVIFPLTLGIFLLVRNKWFKYSLITFAIIEFVILTTYRGFTVFLGAVSVLLLWAIFVRPKKYRLWMIAFISLFFFLSVLLFYTHKDNPAINEYRIKFKRIINISEEFKSEGGFSNRISPWKAAVDIIKDRPLLGYGWGMKKFTKLVQQEELLEKWRVNKPSVYNFYITYKGVFFPPHNLFLEIAVQSGLFGLAAFIFFIGIYLYYLIKNTIRNGSDTDCNFSVILIGGTFLSFMIMNFMSNELGNISGRVLFVVLGAGAAWIKDKELKHSPYSSTR